tara:strand:+ start:1919 stop:2971 length:1053 start_codon:yes stop_codon:yes gene_type:complete
MNFKKLFLKYCKDNQYEINQNQLIIIEELKNYYIENFGQNLITKIFKKKNKKPCFYLMGDVGVGKTMILNFFFDNLKEKKLRLHFNEFMLNFHDFVFKNKDNFKENVVDQFVKDLGIKLKILYFDEFQVTNIVDAMILGKLFKKIIEDDIKVIFSSNIKIENLYKDGLQREQFLPFIKILNEHTYEKELIIDEDYRTTNKNDLKRFLFPLNQSTNFRFSKFFRKLTRNKSQSLKVLDIKGRKLKLENFYEGILKLDFEELCNRNLGAEDYIAISKNSNFIFLENLPSFDENNSNQQQRFITFIDIIYEKKIPLMITSEKDLKFIESSKSLKNIFKRTTSRLYELTSQKYD